MSSSDPVIPDVSVLPPADWPADLASAWTRARQAGGSRYRNADGPAAHWRPATVETVERAVGLWLGWCHARDLSPGLPAPEGLDTYVAWLIDIRGYAATTLTRDIDALSMFCQAVKPYEDWRWLRGLARQCKRRERHAAKPLADARGRVGADHLEALGRRLMHEARASPRPGLYAAICYRDGLMLVMLARRALRRASFMELKLGENIVIDERTLRIKLPAQDMKAKRPHEVPLDTLRAEIDEWLSQWRPLFGVPRDKGAMWPSQYRSALHPKAASKRIGDLTERHLGERVTMHGFRHALATTLSDNLPAGVHVAAAILQHAHTGTTTAHYVRRADALAAQRRADGILDEFDPG